VLCVFLITYHNRNDSTAVDIMNLSMVTLIDNSIIRKKIQWILLFRQRNSLEKRLIDLKGQKRKKDTRVKMWIA